MKSHFKREGTTVKRGLTMDRRMRSKEQGNEKKREERNFADEKHLGQETESGETYPKECGRHKGVQRRKGKRDTVRAEKRGERCKRR
ncbi:hypothetical protein BC827DRAFT_1241160 [Russula dissimulans]|nr:hypothetical protein BC827DRAFT_1241160 [Russula dissimulans]